MSTTTYQGDCRDILGMFYEDNHFDSIVTDPPYGLEFMGKEWDKGVPGVEFWREAFRVLKPGGYMLAFSGTRTYHRMVCAIEDAGFEIRDQIGWVYGSGFPKSLDVSKAIDKAAGAEREVIGRATDGCGNTDESMHKHDGFAASRSAEYDVTAPATEAAKQWQGWGTALKPAWEPIVLARKPLIGTVAHNVLTHGTGGLNIDACRVQHDEECRLMAPSQANIDNPSEKHRQAGRRTAVLELKPDGRWPANVIHDGSDEVLAAFPQAPGAIVPESFNAPSSKASNVYNPRGRRPGGFGNVGSEKGSPVPNGPMYGDKGSAARFFYCAKASKKDRNEGLGDFEPTTTSDGREKPADNAYQRGKTERANSHPTVKPTELMRYLCRLVTPPNGVVLDPFMGSGSTGKAATLEGFRFVGIDLSSEYVAISEARIAAAKDKAAA